MPLPSLIPDFETIPNAGLGKARCVESNLENGSLKIQSKRSKTSVKKTVTSHEPWSNLLDVLYTEN